MARPGAALTTGTRTGGDTAASVCTVTTVDFPGVSQYGTKTLIWVGLQAVMAPGYPSKRTLVLPSTHGMRLFSGALISRVAEGKPDPKNPKMEISSPGAMPPPV